MDLKGEEKMEDIKKFIAFINDGCERDTLSIGKMTSSYCGNCKTRHLRQIGTENSTKGGRRVNTNFDFPMLRIRTFLEAVQREANQPGPICATKASMVR